MIAIKPPSSLSKKLTSRTHISRFPHFCPTVNLEPGFACAKGVRDPIDAVTEQIIGAAIRVHRELGPGLLESAYDACLAFELAERRLAFERQKPLPVFDSPNCEWVS